MWQKYKLDSNVARRKYMVDGSYLNDDDFSAYSPAFLGSNENVPAIINYLQPQGKTALSVIGGADVPLFLSGYGAKHVDTFDISINAYLVMRIKMNMLGSNFEHKSYDIVLQGLSGNPNFMKSVSWETVYDTFHDDTGITKYLYNMNGCGIFGCLPGNPYWTMNDDEYTKIKQNIPVGYNFIWTDLYNLPQHIVGKKYDIIYLSNILQYAGSNQKILDIVNKLHKSLNPHGTIVLDSFTPIYEGEYEFLKNSRQNIICDANAASVFLKTR